MSLECSRERTDLLSTKLVSGVTKLKADMRGEVRCPDKWQSEL